MAHFNGFTSSAQKPGAQKPSTAKHRWEKPQGFAASKTAFDCTGSKKAKNSWTARSKPSSNTAGNSTFFTEAYTETEGTHFGGSRKTPSGGATSAGGAGSFGGASRAAGRAYTINGQKKRSFSPAQAFAKIFGGACMALVGLPLLILPGPGLLFIGGGLALAASGISDLKRAFA